MTFIIDLRAWFPALSSPPGPRSQRTTAIQGILGQSLNVTLFTLKCCLLVPGGTFTSIIIIILLFFQIVPRPLYQSSKPNASPSRAALLFPLIKSHVKASIQTNGNMIGRPKTASPVIIHLKEPIHFPYQKQYSLSLSQTGTSSHHSRTKETRIIG